MTPESAALVTRATTTVARPGVTVTELRALISTLTARVEALDPSTEHEAVQRVIDLADTHNLAVQLYDSSTIRDDLDGLRDDPEMGPAVAAHEELIVARVLVDPEWATHPCCEGNAANNHDARAEIVERATRSVMALLPVPGTH